MTSELTHPTDELEIVNTRTLDAPRELVYEAFSNPEHLIHWWGPQDFTNTFHEFDLRPGGSWLFTMTGPDGKQYEMVKRFIEVAPAEKVVIQHIQEAHNFQMTMTFAEDAGGTKLTWKMVFESAADNAHLEKFIYEANEQNFDRLESHLKNIA